MRVDGAAVMHLDPSVLEAGHAPLGQSAIVQRLLDDARPGHEPVTTGHPDGVFGEALELGSVWMPPRWGSGDVFEGHAFYKDVAPMELEKWNIEHGRWKKGRLGCEVAWMQRVSPDDFWERRGRRYLLILLLALDQQRLILGYGMEKAVSINEPPVA